MKSVVLTERAVRLLERYTLLRGRNPAGWQQGAKQLATGEWLIEMPEDLIASVWQLLQPGETFNDAVMRLMGEALARRGVGPREGQHRHHPLH